MQELSENFSRGGTNEIRYTWRLFNRRTFENFSHILLKFFDEKFFNIYC